MPTIIIVVVLAIILLLPLGIDAGYRGGRYHLALKIGPISVTLAPRKKRKDKKNRREKPEKKAKPPKEPKPKEKISFAEIMELIRLALKALERLRRQICIEYLRIRIIIASSDPFSTATQFGAASAAMGTLRNTIYSSFKVKESDIYVGSDFLASKIEADIWITVTMNLLQLLYVAIAAGIDYIRHRNKFKKLKTRAERAVERPPDTERTEVNGKTPN